MGLLYGQVVTWSEREILDYFSPDEGSINFYFGRIRGGKNYAATCDILERLDTGSVEYVNYHINWDGFDQRNSFKHRFMHTVFFRKRFYHFKPENLRYFDRNDVTPEWLNTLTDCNITIDEGHWVINSYEGTKIKKEVRELILNTGHVNRTLNIISQRTQAVHVTARANVNRFFLCEVKRRWPWLTFRRTEFQDMSGEDVDTSEEAIVDVKVYLARQRIFDAYDTHYLRGELQPSQYPIVDAYDLTFKERIQLLFSKRITTQEEDEEDQTDLPEEGRGSEQDLALAQDLARDAQPSEMLFPTAQDFQHDAFWKSWRSKRVGQEIVRLDNQLTIDK